MGSILEAEDCKLPRTVAVKIILSEINADEEQKRRFINEAAVLARLAHPNIVPVYDIGRDKDRQVYYSMKLVKGRTLKAILTDVRAEIPEALRHYTLDRLLTIFRKVCDAIAFAHSRGIIHRDLKPENIMVGEFGEVLVMDWGLAKDLGTPHQVPTISSGPAAAVHFTGAHAGQMPEPGAGGMNTIEGSVMGTPKYMSPEQAAGRTEDMDPRSDIYSLGGILYCILTLRPPVEGKTVEEVLAKVVRAEIGPLQGAGVPPTRDPAPGGRGRPHSMNIPESLSAVVRKAMALDKAKRYQNVTTLSADIEAWQGGFATSAEHAGLVKQVTLLVRRHKALFATAFVAWLVITALAVWFVININHERNVAIGERKTAVRERNRAEDALSSLRQTAPTLVAQAQSLVTEQKLDEAILKLDFALMINPDNADYALQRANYLQAALRLPEAHEAYRSLLRRGPNAAATANLALCEKLLAAQDDEDMLPETALDELRTALIAQHREAEAMPLTARLGKGKDAMLETIRERLQIWRELRDWRDDRVHLDANRKITIDLKGLPISDLSPLRGLYVEHLVLMGTQVTDLRPLAGMRLRELKANLLTRLRSLEGLEGTPLSILSIERTGVSDLSPLRAAPLRYLSISGTSVTDLSPIKDCPLQQLLAVGTAIQSIEPLRGKQLLKLYLSGCQALTDITALKDCPQLGALTLPPRAQDIEFLRNKPRLGTLSYKSHYLYTEPVAEFWAAYDAKKAAEKK